MLIITEIVLSGNEYQRSTVLENHLKKSQFDKIPSDPICHVQSVIIYFLAVGTYAGSDVGIWHFGTVIVTQCLVVMSIHLAIETKSWTIVHVLSIVLSVAGMEINL